MTPQQKALQDCITVLEEALTYIESPSWSPSMARDCREAITQAKQALDHVPDAGKMVQVQPEAWWELNESLDAWFLAYSHNPKAKTRPLYAYPQASEPSKDAKTWCEYVAGMIGGYLNEPVDSDKCKAIAGIIERRLWALPASPEAK